MRFSKFSSLALMAIALAQAATGGIKEFWQSDKPPSKADRRAAADSFLKQIAPIDDAVPEASPTQRAWLKREYDDEIERAGGTYTQRSLLARESPEFYMVMAKPTLHQLRTALADLSSTRQITLKREMELWAVAAAAFSNTEGNQAILGLLDKGVLSKELFGTGPAHEGWQLNQSLRANIILERIIIPYLRNQLHD